MPAQLQVDGEQEVPVGPVDDSPGDLTDSSVVQRSGTFRTIGPLKLRGKNDDLPQRWWFASTAIPLIAATTGPLCNILSIASLVSPWRVALPNNGQLPEGTDDNGVGIADPKWELALNGVSLACGFIGNIFLLLNFTGRIRYIISLPMSIVFWYLSSDILIGITVAVHVYVPPIGPGEIYAQGYWHAVLAAILYFIGASILLINMLGYLLGYYPQQFELDDDQRTLILQTMMFFFWMAIGAGIFCRIEGFSYANSLYYVDVVNMYPTSDAGRGFLFVFVLIGIIFLGLVISSISRFAANISADKIIKTHQRHVQRSAAGRTVTSERELRERLGLPSRPSLSGADISTIRRGSLNRYGHVKVQGRTVTFHEHRQHGHAGGGGRGGAARINAKPLSRDEKLRARAAASSPLERRRQRRQKLLLLREERDRFDAMREIQAQMKHFKQYMSLSLAILAFGVLWCMGALVFRYTEERLLGLSYFQTLYFCFVSLLTIGYGDMAPRSNIGKPFFIVWSLIAVPTMTVLVQQMSDTIVSAVNRGTFHLADWTILPKKGVLIAFIKKYPLLHNWLRGYQQRRQEDKRIAAGFPLQTRDEEDARASIPDATGATTPSRDGDRALERVVRENEAQLTEHELARQLAKAIRTVAHDMRAETPKRYSYEQWVHFTRLIRFSQKTGEEGDGEARKEEEGDEDEGLIEWDWIGEDSPMLADVSEAEWILERLLESLTRYSKRQAHKSTSHKTRDKAVEGNAESGGQDIDEGGDERDPVPYSRDNEGTSQAGEIFKGNDISLDQDDEARNYPETTVEMGAYGTL